MLTFPELKSLLAQQGFGTPTNIDHVAKSLREAGMISAGNKTPMTAEDAVAMMLGMSCRGTVREKFFNVEALLAMELHDYTDRKPKKAFGQVLADRLRHLRTDLQTTVTIVPDQPSATISTVALTQPRSADKIEIFMSAKARAIAMVEWRVEIHHRAILAIAEALR